MSPSERHSADPSVRVKSADGRRSAREGLNRRVGVGGRTDGTRRVTLLPVSWRVWRVRLLSEEVLLRGSMASGGGAGELPTMVPTR